MILAEGARLKSIGEKGLEILPGVKSLLDSVSNWRQDTLFCTHPS